MVSLYHKALVLLGILTKKYTFIGPRSLMIYVPSICNHSCLFCGNISQRKPWNSPDVLKFEHYLFLIEDAIKLKVGKIIFTSNGETLLYPYLKELIQFAKRKSNNFLKIRIITNGTLLDWFGVDFLIKNKIEN